MGPPPTPGWGWGGPLVFWLARNQTFCACVWVSGQCGTEPLPVCVGPRVALFDLGGPLGWGFAGVLPTLPGTGRVPRPPSRQLLSGLLSVEGSLEQGLAMRRQDRPRPSGGCPPTPSPLPTWATFTPSPAGGRGQKRQRNRTRGSHGWGGGGAAGGPSNTWFCETPSPRYSWAPHAPPLAGLEGWRWLSCRKLRRVWRREGEEWF